MDRVGNPVRSLALLALFAFATACGNEPVATGSGDPTEAPAGPRLVTPPEARILAAWLARIPVVDVRTAEEYAAGHLPGAWRVELDEIGRALDDGRFPVSRETPLLVYCRGGRRSAQAAALLSQRGFSQVYDLEGGITAWDERGYPIAP